MLVINLDDSQAQNELARLLSNATNTRPLMRSLAQELKTLTDENFESQSFGGASWQAKAFGSGRILQDSGELQDSITPSSDATTASIGTNLIYARIHHMGGTIQAKNKPYLMFKTPNGFARVKSVTLPARPFLPISADGQLQSGADRRLIDIALESLTQNR